MDIRIRPSEEKPSKGDHMFSLKYSYQVDSAEPNPDSPLKLQVSNTVDNSLHRVNVKIENQDDGRSRLGLRLKMICILAVPTGCKVNLNDLEGLRLNSIIDFYELRRDSSEIVLYWRGVKAKGAREFSLSLLSEFKVQNRLPLLVSTYLYYDKDGSLVCFKQ